MCNACDCYLTFAGEENRVPTEQDIIQAINKKTKIITFCNISNLLGYKLDIKKISSAARKINKDIIIIVDATQAVPHKSLDVRKEDLDFFVCSGYKMLSGTGIGLLYMKDK
jgi:cysteine desulfurase/selenocysteine lyase